MKTFILIITLLFTFAASGQEKSAKTKQAKVTKDTVYIPEDLDDCLRQLDKIFSDTVKIQIKALSEDEFTGRIHRDFGMRLRNSWGLWGNSRLSRYFHQLGVHQAESMSGIIFTSYYRKLTGREINLEGQIKSDKEYWEEAKKQDLQRQSEAFAEFIVHDTVLYNYKKGFASKAQEKKFDSNKCIAWGIVTEKDESKLFIKVRLIEACDKRGVIFYNSKKVLVLNKKTHKLEVPKKKVIEYMKVGEENWFSYSEWEIN